MRTYATVTDLLRTSDGAKVDKTKAVELLRSAHRLIRNATGGAVYLTDDYQFPVNGLTRDAFRDATCAQVIFWSKNNIDPDLPDGGMAPLVASASINGGSVSYAVTPEMLQARANMVDKPCANAMSILSDAGLVSNRIRVL